ncbi:MAG TPA: hypothetical protein VN578_25735 [Candidatus Binatia bacterium]|jgi:hypothetical protein|nr:hypothetical protein [Candidatus Binatia bacterium]
MTREETLDLWWSQASDDSKESVFQLIEMVRGRRQGEGLDVRPDGKAYRVRVVQPGQPRQGRAGVRFRAPMSGFCQAKDPSAVGCRPAGNGAQTGRRKSAPGFVMPDQKDLGVWWRAFNSRQKESIYLLMYSVNNAKPGQVVRIRISPTNMQLTVVPEREETVKG